MIRNVSLPNVLRIDAILEDEALQPPQVLLTEEHMAERGFAVTASPAGFLDEVFDAARRVVMDDGTDIPLVHTHAWESIGAQRFWVFERQEREKERK